MFVFAADSLFLVYFLLIPLDADASAAQSISVPPITPTKTNEHPYKERLSLARAALDVGINGGSTDASGTLAVGDIYETTPLLFSQLAEFDIITHNTTYRDLLKVQIPRTTAEIASSSDYVSYSIISSRAYTAYQDSHFLTTAQQLWDFGRAHCISGEDIKSKRIATKSLSLRSTCDGKTLVGGVFTVGSMAILWIVALTDILKTSDAKDGELESESTSAFLILSTLLAEVTSNATYIEAATQTLQFLRNFAYFPSSNGVDGQRRIFALDDSNQPCHSDIVPDWYPITGDLIEGLSILASIQDDTSTENLLSGRLQQVINSSTLLRQDQRPDGILNMNMTLDGYPTGDPYLVRGLTTAYKKNRIDPVMSDYIKGFLNVQYDALLSNARLPGNLYGGSWIGPPDQKFSLRNQTYGAMVLVQAISLANDTSPGGNSTSPSLPGPSKSLEPGVPGKSTGPNLKIRAIVGGVVGGLSFVAVLSGVAAFLILRRRHRNREGGDQWMFLPFPLILESNGNDSTSPIPQSGSRVKDRSNFAPQPPVTAREDTNRDVPLNEDTYVRYQDMSTAEMAQILNARLRNESFNAGMPPAYE
ncbi:hypothetical protein E1B28_003619 [Marasmius oreades]|uniref:Glycoside hydrolase family 76 protein n=1 Tax=Marasmius oreades TaxID=181124 RepID=A0A9P7UL41_9AGAR|nr:uncharacterized protein E1B28_003619 [Marasmius oreades]KAG7086105.1 hypothetical protein E1B28_003619 [Marasmius oreades]